MRVQKPNCQHLLLSLRGTKTQHHCLSSTHESCLEPDEPCFSPGAKQGSQLQQSVAQLLLDTVFDKLLRGSYKQLSQQVQTVKFLEFQSGEQTRPAGRFSDVQKHVHNILFKYENFILPITKNVSPALATTYKNRCLKLKALLFDVFSDKLGNSESVE